MAISDRQYDSRLSFGDKINPLVILIAINMMVFVVLLFFKALSYLRHPEGADIDGIFAHDILGLISLNPHAAALANKPWTLLTYSIAQGGIWQLVANMIWLWSFGFLFTDLTGYKKIVPVYIYGTLAGAAAYLLAGSLMHSTLNDAYFNLFGASAAIMAIAIAATTIAPQYKVFPMLNGGISLWIITLIYVVIDLATLPANFPALHIAHIAAGVSGFLFIYLLRKGHDGSEWMNNLYDWFMNLFNPDASARQKDIRNTLFYKANKSPFRKSSNLTQQKLDEILDKINYSGGYDNLTEEEKEFLKRASQEDVKGS